MNNYELVKFKNQSVELDVRISLEDNTIWLTKEQIAKLLNRDRSVISRYLKSIYEEGELDRSTSVHFLHISPNEKNPPHRQPELYNMDVVMSISDKIKSQNGSMLKEWFNNYISDKSKDIIVYNNGNIRLDVKVEPMKETVWLNANQMATLFDTSTDNIYLHIKNIYSEGEIDNSVTEDSSATQKEIVQIAADGKSYLTTLYNLDVILAVGYRIKGKRAIEFRRWASSVLKQYLLKGYAIDEKRTLVTNENYINLINKVNSLDNDVKEIKEILTSRFPNSYICYEGKYYEGFAFVNNLIRLAKERVIVIDGYADESVLDFFFGSKKDIKKIILCHKKDRISTSIVDRFIKEYGNTIIKEDKSYHDRFLIIDNEIYLLGVSLNSLGNKTSTITKTNQYKIEEIYKDE